MYRCGRCHGKGKLGHEVCPLCDGWGVLAGFMKQCTVCSGTGCYQCNGKGTVMAPVRFETPRLLRIPISLLAEAWRALREGAELKLPDHTRGVVAGVLLAFANQREDEGNPPGYQLRQLLHEGGSLVIAPDGIWHLVEGRAPVRVLMYATVVSTPLS